MCGCRSQQEGRAYGRALTPPMRISVSQSAPPDSQEGKGIYDKSEQARHGKDSQQGPTHDQFPRPLAPGRPVWNGAFIAHAEMLAAE